MAIDVQLPERGPVVNLQTEAGATATVSGATTDVKRTTSTPAGVIGRVRLTTVNGGTPTLDADIEDSWDGTNWSVLITFAQLTAAGEETLAASRLPGPFIRGTGVIGGGSPDIDFRIDILGIITE